MIRISLRKGAALFAFLLLSLPLRAQVSFFQPPPYTGVGNVFVADFNGDGKPDLLTSDGTLSLGNGDGTFKVTTPAAGPILAVADFNGDGKPDLLEQGTGTLLVLLGNGDGTFQTAISTASGASLTTVAATDLNGDGKADVVGVFNDMLMVYIGKGDGTFASGVSYNPHTMLGNMLSLGDFNGDHKIDIAISTPGNTVVGQEIVFLGNGDGTLQSPKTSTGGYNPQSTAVGDFNGDGKADLLVSSAGFIGGVQDTVYILLGNGDGTFQTPTAAFPGAGQLAVADLNGDGKLDVAFTNAPSVVEIHLGNGDGTFSNSSNYALFPPSSQVQGGVSPPGGFGGPIALADFNLDGKLDIAANGGAFGGSVLLGNGNGTFQGIPIGLLPGEGVAASGNAAPELGPFVTGNFDKTNPTPGVAVVGMRVVGNVNAAISNNLYILRNDGHGVLSLVHTYTLQAPGVSVVTADFNGDGNLDLMVFNAPPNSWGYSVLLGNGDGSFQPPVFSSQAVGLSVLSPVVADFNGDKKLDVAVSLAGNQTLAVLLGNGDGTFAAPSYVFDGGAGPLVSADFNSDGKADLAGGGTVLLFGKGDGTFQPAVFPSNLSAFQLQLTADFNNDGKPDLLGAAEIALGNGDGTFTLLSIGNDFGIDAVADLNGDGKLDLFGTSNNPINGKPEHEGVLLGNGDGTFSSSIPLLQSGILPAGLVVADMNNDGRPDIIVPLQNNVTGLAVWLNTTPPGFGVSATALSPATVTSGSATTSTVKVSPTSSFSGSVTLSCVGLPSGASCQFSPASIAGASGTSSLTITTTSGAAAGTYPVKIQGTAGSLTTTATLSLVIQAPVVPDFTIAAPSPNTQTVAAGKSATFTLALAPSGSFSGTVNLSCAVTPAATRPPTCTLSSPSVQISSSGSQSVTVTVATTSPTTAGAVPPVNLPAPPLLLLWTLSLLSLAWLSLRYRKRQPIFVPLLLVLVFASLAGCGGGSLSPSPTGTTGTPTGTYTATITATSGSATHNATVQVVVQ